jgi:hypothetical protein
LHGLLLMGRRSGYLRLLQRCWLHLPVLRLFTFPVLLPLLLRLPELLDLLSQLGVFFFDALSHVDQVCRHVQALLLAFGYLNLQLSPVIGELGLLG